MTESTGRINKFDNLKGLAILLIVLGHLTFFRNYPAMGLIRNFVFLIHIPIFFFVSGYFSKTGPDEPVKAFKRLFIPYIVFCIIWEIFNVYVMHEAPNSILFIHPGYMLWFLMSLFIMKMSLPIMERLKHPIIVAVIASMLIGFIDANILGISRAFIFMPIYLIGYYYEDLKIKAIDKLPLIENNYFAISVLILSLVSSVIIAYIIPFDAIIMKHSYGHHLIHDILIRGLLILITTINVLVITRFMTNKKISLTQFGLNSLTVYLLHPYAISLTKLIAKPYLKGHQKMILAFVLIMTFIIVYVLSRNIITKAFNKFLNGIYRVIGL